jgi:hypothetical protein
MGPQVAQHLSDLAHVTHPQHDEHEFFLKVHRPAKSVGRRRKTFFRVGIAQKLTQNVSNSWAMTSIRRRVQSGFMKQIAINGLTYVRKIRAQVGAGQL